MVLTRAEKNYLHGPAQLAKGTKRTVEYPTSRAVYPEVTCFQESRPRDVCSKKPQARMDTLAQQRKGGHTSKRGPDKHKRKKRRSHTCGPYKQETKARGPHKTETKPRPKCPHCHRAFNICSCCGCVWSSLLNQPNCCYKTKGLTLYCCIYKRPNL